MWALVLYGQGGCGLKEAEKEGAVPCLEPAALWQGEALLGEGKGRDGKDGLLQGHEALLDRGAEGAERGDAARGDDGVWVGEESVALGIRFSQAQGSDESEGLAMLEGGALQ